MMVRPSVRAPNFQISIENEKLQWESKTILLAFILSDSLSCDGHIDQVCIKLNKSLALFQNCREFINRRAAFKFYYNFFFCHLIYGISLFENLAPNYLLNGIFLLQKRAFCLIATIATIPYHLIQTSDLPTLLNLVPFPQLPSKSTCIFGCHVLNSRFPYFSAEDFSFTYSTD